MRLSILLAFTASLPLATSRSADAKPAKPAAAKPTAPAAPAPPPIPDGKARLVFLHLGDKARDRTLSAWKASGLDVEVKDVKYGAWAVADVDPGPQGFAGRLSGQVAPSKEKLGANTGLGNLAPGSLTFVVASRANKSDDAVETRSERAIAAAPAAGRAALRVMGVWPGAWTVSICEAGDGGAETPVVNSMGGPTVFGYGKSGPVHDRPAGRQTLVVHRPTNPAERCSGPVLGRATVELAADSRTTAFLFGKADPPAPGGLRLLACTETPSLRCDDIKLTP